MTSGSPDHYGQTVPVASRRIGQGDGASEKDVAGHHQSGESVEVVVGPYAPWSRRIHQRGGKAGVSQKRAAFGQPPLPLWSLLGGCEGPVTVEAAKRHLWVNLVDHEAGFRSREKEVIDLADVAGDVPALNGGREGRCAGRAGQGLGLLVVAGMNRRARRHREDARSPAREIGPGCAVGHATPTFNMVGQADRDVDPNADRRLRTVEEIGDAGEPHRVVAAGIIQIEEDARPGASAAIEPGDPARHANRGGSGGLTLLKDGAPQGPSRLARKRRRRRCASQDRLMDIAVDKVTEIILRVRALDVKEGPTDPDSGSNPIDDGATDVLTSSADDATESEIRSMINGLNDDERANLLALLYVGRGDMEAEEWGEAVRFARERESVGEGALREIMGSPDAGDLLDEGLAALGISQDIPDA